MAVGQVTEPAKGFKPTLHRSLTEGSGLRITLTETCGRFLRLDNAEGLELRVDCSHKQMRRIGADVNRCDTVAGRRRARYRGVCVEHRQPRGKHDVTLPLASEIRRPSLGFVKHLSL